MYAADHDGAVQPWYLPRPAIFRAERGPQLGRCRLDLGLAVRTAALRLRGSADQGQVRPRAAVQVWRRYDVLRPFPAALRLVSAAKTGQTSWKAGSDCQEPRFWLDRKSTRLNSSHSQISYA